MSLALILALVALACGILMLVSGRWSKAPLAAIAIICLALNQSGLLGRIQERGPPRLVVTLRPLMAHRPVHLLEAGIVTEQRFAGVIEAPAALGKAFAERLQPEKRVRIPFNPRDRWLTAAREAC